MDFNILQSYLNKLPDIKELMLLLEVKMLSKRYSEKTVKEYLKTVVDVEHKKIASAVNEDEIKQFDISKEYFVKKLKKELFVEKGKPLKKIINCMGIIYSEYIGDRFYNEEVLENFKTIFSKYSNFELDEESGKKSLVENEIKKFISSDLGEMDFLLCSNIKSALYLMLNEESEKNVVTSLKDIISFDDGTNIKDLVKESGKELEIVGSINSFSIDDYKNVEESVVIYTRMFENSIDGLGSLSGEDIKSLEERSKRFIYISDRVYYRSEHDEIKSIANSFRELVERGYGTYILDMSRVAGLPDLGLILGSKEEIEKLRNSFLYKLLTPSKERKALYYLILKEYAEHKSETVYINSCFDIGEESVKKRNRRFMKELGAEFKDSVQMELIDGKFLTINDKYGEGFKFNRELFCIIPKEKNVVDIESKLRNGDPSVLCWRDDGALVFNLQLIKEDEEKELMNILKKNLK